MPSFNLSSRRTTKSCILVNNAGMSIRRSVSKSYQRIHDFERTLTLNFLGPVRLILGLVPKMRERSRARIVNVSTMGVQVGVPRFEAYIASKAAPDAFSGRIPALSGVGQIRMNKTARHPKRPLYLAAFSKHSQTEKSVSRDLTYLDIRFQELIFSANRKRNYGSLLFEAMQGPYHPASTMTMQVLCSTHHPFGCGDPTGVPTRCLVPKTLAP